MPKYHKERKTTKMEKNILLQVAMEIECQEILKQLRNIEEININNYKYYKGTIHDYPIIISLSKVGLINASASLTLAIREFNPTIIINTGIAGATDRKLHIGDIILGLECLNINSYRTPILKEGEGSNPQNWELLTFLSGEEDRIIKEKADETLISLAKEINTNKYGQIYTGTIGSGDVWNREIDRIISLNEKHHILCEDMESIATYTIANQQNIPVISIKMISDNSITGEEYNRQMGKYLEKYIVEYLTKIIKKQEF